MQDDYDKLKKLLLQDEIDQLNTLTRIIKNLEKKHHQDVVINDLSKIITKILTKSIENNRLELYAALQPLISKGIDYELAQGDRELQRHIMPIIATSLDHQIHNDKQRFVKALSPMMGEMIREYLRQGIDTLEAKIRSLFGLKKAKVDESENIEAIFLINKTSTLLMTHLFYNELVKIPKTDAMVKVRTTIEQAKKDQEDLAEIYEVPYGSHRLSLIEIRGCYVALISKYSINNFLMQNKLTKVVTQVIDECPSITDSEQEAQPIDIPKMQKILAKLFNNQKAAKRSFPWLVTLLTTLMLLAPSGWFGYKLYQEHRVVQIKERVHTILVTKNQIKIYDLKIAYLGKKKIRLSGLVLDSKQKEKIDALLPQYSVINEIEAMEHLKETSKSSSPIAKVLGL